MELIVLPILLFLLALINATAIPSSLNGAEAASSLVARNETSGSGALADYLTFNISPNPVGPPCGMTWEVNINVESRGSVGDTSNSCDALYNYVTLPSSSVSQTISKDVNFVYLCPPETPAPISAEGYGSRDIKFIVQGTSDFPGNQNTFLAQLQVLNIDDSPETNMNLPVEIGYAINDNADPQNQLTLRYIICP
ncbi:uncharacterized protein Z520_04396 [Fonsecaea multimorphosa CBS 102226]|uniref:Ubiquitin 3 binding protein But2 C-terminal domain-containing protein n=1 Tax=Fonsecaea multimorphosa CBS 102226 TaxID=1442371 RepID=A0A0D2HCZ5_9EURO|nr:uncharacterized protein Z520_04396 [Fonsecaea multimorphosa CBS 102226]KIX99760.1 hypothetical protein Z520_04396 [Fonsecaea multimorphosa CBS 102226]OAL26548.1 hypothetical protein AYO22_04159 [Fonsecaea multimorphosa]